MSTDKVQIGSRVYDMSRGEPAVLPLAAILLTAPLPVRALKNSQDVKKGGDYFVSHILADGRIALIGQPGKFYAMDTFVELLHIVPAAENDNAKK